MSRCLDFARHDIKDTQHDTAIMSNEENAKESKNKEHERHSE